MMAFAIGLLATSVVMAASVDEALDRAEHFLESLYAIANADGMATPEEIVEIKAIAAEFGLEEKSPE